MRDVTHARGRPTDYRPYLDGVRTLAVYLVIAFHTGLGLFTGGFIGVDVFFVLSGFLVTSILMRDLAGSGRVRWRRFYSQRVRRILPAAIVTLLVTSAVYAAIASPAQVLDAYGGVRAAFFYVTNWHFVQQSTDYFAANVNTNPVLHFWSLAVEEQFYLVWPLAIGVLFLVTSRAGRWRWWILRGAVAILGLASVWEALHFASTSLSRAYYGTDTRAYQLLAGAAIALTPQLLHLPGRAGRIAQWAAALAFSAIVVLGTSSVSIGPITRGVLIAVLAPLLIVALANAPGGRLKRALSTGPVTYLGRISYGTYLWHWPLIIFLTLNHTIAPLPLFVVDTLGATALAALSFKILESPIRFTTVLDRFRGPVIAIGFSTSILIGLVVVPIVLDSGSGAVAIAAPGAGPHLLDWRLARKDVPPVPDCLGKPVDECTVVKGTGAHMILMGDSTARMWIPAFVDMAKHESLTLSIAFSSGCPWQLGLQYNLGTEVTKPCAAHQKDWFTRVVPQLDPDIIVLAHQADDDPARTRYFIAPDGNNFNTTSPGFEQTLMNLSSGALTKLARPGREIAVIEPTPLGPNLFDPDACLSTGKAPGDCSYTANAQPTLLEQFYRRLAQPNITSIDLDRLQCPRWPTCDAVVRNIIVKRDAVHLTATYAESTWMKVDAVFRKQHLVQAATASGG